MVMSKDSYWFKHDSNSGRGERLRRIQFVYTHWGKGIYWDVIEYLRDQDGYKSTKDDLSLRIICDIIGCKDEAKFINWFKDCIKTNLLQCDETHFWSDVLVENMAKWEAKKLNGSQGGRGNKKANRKLIESELKANRKLIESIIEDNRIEDNSIYDGISPNNFLFPLEAPSPKKNGRPKSEEEVVAYLTEEGYESPQENANKFFNFYQSKGWKVGKNAMVDWKSAVKTWKFAKTGVTPTPQHPYTEEQVRQIKRRLERDGDGSYPEWFDLKYKSILNYYTLVGNSTRRGEE